MVGGKQEAVLVIRQMDHSRTQQRGSRQVEWLSYLVAHHTSPFTPAFLLRLRTQVQVRQREICLRQDGLYRLSVALGKCGAQYFMAAHEFLDGSLHRFRNVLSVEVNNVADVADGAAEGEMVQEPELFLRKRKRGM